MWGTFYIKTSNTPKTSETPRCDSADLPEATDLLLKTASLCIKFLPWWQVRNSALHIPLSLCATLLCCLSSQTNRPLEAFPHSSAALWWGNRSVSVGVYVRCLSVFLCIIMVTSHYGNVTVWCSTVALIGCAFLGSFISVFLKRHSSVCTFDGAAGDDEKSNWDITDAWVVFLSS